MDLYLWKKHLVSWAIFCVKRGTGTGFIPFTLCGCWHWAIGFVHVGSQGKQLLAFRVKGLKGKTLQSWQVVCFCCPFCNALFSSIGVIMRGITFLFELASFFHYWGLRSWQCTLIAAPAIFSICVPSLSSSSFHLAYSWLHRKAGGKTKETNSQIDQKMIFRNEIQIYHSTPSLCSKWFFNQNTEFGRNSFMNLAIWHGCRKQV